ncbi:hypothetical protein B5G43_12735 [Flavonifractor sp. An92]|uniref:InlB B-repeat-containing protein n=1 Tax=Flavonifractor sp. An92 TaxID=1965666 RepID=UPI000B36558D|nr:InlB B-repeat-containing protein [Flavonifractor sp. An92]OUN05545.1 hypothetical protein B5G43_12735 [Flavonifractor sp. An92]
MKKQIIKQAAALSLAVAVMAPAASALSWKDGAPANYHFTYAGDNGGIASVTASDKNGTYQGGMEVGQTITTKTGTIVWRDSYTNVTTFTVDVKPGYVLSELAGQVGDAQFTAVDEDTYTFQFTDKGAEAWCYGDDVEFTLLTEKIPYTVNFYADGELINHTKTTVNDPLDLSVVPEKEGYTFTGWYVNGEKLTADTLTEDLIKLAGEDKTLDLTAGFTINNYAVRVEYYEDNTQGQPTSVLDTRCDYGDIPTVSKDYKLVGGGEVGPITGDTTLKLVKYSPVVEDDWSYEYGFLYNSKDAGVQSVEYSIDDSKYIAIDVNEGVKFETSLVGDNHTRTITFRVQVADGMKLVLDSNGGKEVTEVDGWYTFTFTRSGAQGSWIGKNVPNVTFDLTTVEK